MAKTDIIQVISCVSLENKPHLFQERFCMGCSIGFGLFLTKKMMDVYSWKIKEKSELCEGAKIWNDDSLG